MEKQTYTAEEVVDITINILSEISIPVQLSETVGLPVQRSIGNLKVLKAKYEQERLEAEKGEEDAGEADSE